MISFSCIAIAANSPGPAPSSGDGISNGSGFPDEEPQSENAAGIGPAPNSGDGIPDSSGF